MKTCIIIGTRPQYVKFKPLYNFLKNNKCDFIVIDTNQHYSDNMSRSFIEEFELNINCNLLIPNSNPVNFISDVLIGLHKIISRENISDIIVMGDTNTTLAGALFANKMGFRLSHIEAGMRCGDKNRPEEINRIITDTLSNIHFTSRREDNKNVFNPFYTGDLEFGLLNSMSEKGDIPKQEFKNYIFMTLHRQENIEAERLEYIFKLCELSRENFILPLHHSTKISVEKNKINIPENIRVIEPLGYKEVIAKLSECKAIFSDSGGILKVSPFFGKKCLVPLGCTEYDDLIELGYAKLGINFDWLVHERVHINRDLYYLPNSCEIIYDNLSK